MHVLLDECVPRPLRGELTEHEVKTVQELGWAGTRNGPVLKLIKDAGFDVLVTTDQRIEHQQNIEAAGVAVVVLVARSNRLRALLPLVPQLQAALARARPGDVIRVSL
jgi:hypothetical protein